jgi:hypothetical protein
VDIATKFKPYGIKIIVYHQLVMPQQALEYAGVEFDKLWDLHKRGAVIFARLTAQYFIDTLKSDG